MEKFSNGSVKSPRFSVLLVRVWASPDTPSCRTFPNSVFILSFVEIAEITIQYCYFMISSSTFLQLERDITLPRSRLFAYLTPCGFFNTFFLMIGENKYRFECVIVVFQMGFCMLEPPSHIQSNTLSTWRTILMNLLIMNVNLMVYRGYMIGNWGTFFLDSFFSSLTFLSGKRTGVDRVGLLTMKGKRCSTRTRVAAG